MEVRVEGRRRTAIFVDGGECLEREVRIAVPSSPAPRTSMLFVVIFGRWIEKVKRKTTRLKRVVYIYNFLEVNLSV